MFFWLNSLWFFTVVKQSTAVIFTERYG